MNKASQTGGVKPMPIAGRMVNERERLAGMTDAERAWRKQWLKDQELAPNEPRQVPEMYRALHNPIRRFYRWPLNQFEKVLAPILGQKRATAVRYLTGKVFLGTAILYSGYYYFKYNPRDWTRKGGFRVLQSREVTLPGDPGFPCVSDRNQPSDYGHLGFKDVTLKL